MLTKTFNGEIPNTTEKISVVTNYADTGIQIRDFVDAILNYDYQDETAYLEAGVEETFNSICESAKLFKECGGNFETYFEKLQEVNK